MPNKIIPVIKLNPGHKPVKKLKVEPQAFANFLSALPVRVFDGPHRELPVLSVYLDDSGSICVDVRQPLLKAVN